MWPATWFGWAIGVKAMVYLVLHRFSGHTERTIELIEERTIGPQAILLSRSPRQPRRTWWRHLRLPRRAKPESF